MYASSRRSLLFPWFPHRPSPMHRRTVVPAVGVVELARSSRHTRRVARTTLKVVDVYPHFVDRDAKALAAASAAASEIFGDVIAPERLPARDWLFRLNLHPSDGVTALEVELHDDMWDGEGGSVFVPRGIAALPVAERAALALDLLHASLVRLAELRGWDRRVIDAARQQVLDNGGARRRASAWKKAPDRRHRARAVRYVGPEGRVLAWMEIERCEDGTVVASPDITVNRTSRIGAAQLRWLDSRTVRLTPADPSFSYELTYRLDAPGHDHHTATSLAPAGAGPLPVIVRVMTSPPDSTPEVVTSERLDAVIGLIGGRLPAELLEYLNEPETSGTVNAADALFVHLDDVGIPLDAGERDLLDQLREEFNGR